MYFCLKCKKIEYIWFRVLIFIFLWRKSRRSKGKVKKKKIRSKIFLKLFFLLFSGLKKIIVIKEWKKVCYDYIRFGVRVGRGGVLGWRNWLYRSLLERFLFNGMIGGGGGEEFIKSCREIKVCVRLSFYAV